MLGHQRTNRRDRVDVPRLSLAQRRPKAMGDRCTGHCCREFPLPLTPDELAAGTEAPESWDRHFWQTNAIFLRAIDARHSYFTCRQYDTKTGDCRAYESRPYTCRHYPQYDGYFRCSNRGCTWTEQRADGGHLLVGKVSYTGEEEDMKQDPVIRRVRSLLTIGGRYRVRRRDP